MRKLRCSRKTAPSGEWPKLFPPPLYPLTFGEGQPSEHVMFTAHHSSSSSNAFYCDPQAVRVILGKGKKPCGATVKSFDIPESKCRQDSVTSTSGPTVKFVEPEKQPKKAPKPLKKRQKAKNICSAMIRRLKTSS